MKSGGTSVKILHKIERTPGISITLTQVTGETYFLSPIVRSLLSVGLSSLPAIRSRGWRWRPLINFSRWLALFVRRYGIFPLRFSNRSSILNPSDSSVLFFLPCSLFSSFCLPLSRAHRPTPLPLPPPCVSPVHASVRGQQTRRHERGEYERECRKRRKRRGWAFSIPGTLVRI